MIYSDYQALTSSQKVGLVTLDASQQLVGWTVFSGSIYQLAIPEQVLISVKDSGTALTTAASAGAVTAGKYFFDRVAGILYLRTSDSVNPNGKFIAATYRLFFSNFPVKQPNDLASGFVVEWLPYLVSTSSFGVAVDNKNLLGFAIESTGTVTLANDQTYWSPRFDKYYFENQLVFVYSWTFGLPITEAKIIYRGRVTQKTFSLANIQLGLTDAMNELRAPVPLVLMSALGGSPRIPSSIQNAYQRLLYGYVKGHKPTNIDQQLTGYPIAGTVTPSGSSVTGSGTSFLAKLSPGDQVSFGSETTTYNVNAVTSDTVFTITQTYAGSLTGAVCSVVGKTPKRWMNRIFLVAGHALKEPSTTVALPTIDTTSFNVVDATDFNPGDQVLVSGELHTIRTVSGNKISLATSLALAPMSGSTVLNLSVQNVYIDNALLTYSRDYTYGASTGKITLDPLAEFNVAPVYLVTGTATFTSGSRVVTGSGTTFKADFVIGDWVAATGQAYFEVLSVDSDTQLTLRTVSSYNAASVAILRKNPNVYNEGATVLSCDVFGVTEDGTSSGTFIKTAAQAVKDLLNRSTVSATINSSSFTTAQALAPYKIGLAIPSKYGDTTVSNLRDVISSISQSVFGSLYQNPDFQLEYTVLSPVRAQGITALTESDILDFAIQTDSTLMAKTVYVNYLNKEYDHSSAADSTFTQAIKSSNRATYLANTQNVFTTVTVLIDSTEAQIVANRWSFILEVASTIVTFHSKLQVSRLKINDKVEINHRKLYQRIGSSATRKIAGVSSAMKTVSDCTIGLDDIANSFSRCAVISPTVSNAFAGATDTEKLYNGYITDTYGMMSNDPSTFGVNLIW